MSAPALELEVREGIAVLTFTRPETRNAIGEELIGELDAALSAMEQSTEARALIVTGSGACFMAGGDIRMLHQGLEQPYAFFRLHDQLTRASLRLSRLRIPVIAAINGHAFGGGLELALACDFRILADSARLGLPEVGLGIMPASGGTARLARLIGFERALYLALTGEAVDAATAERMGLVGRVVPQAEVMGAARELATRISRQAPAAVAMIKRAMCAAADMPLEGAIDYCQAAGLLLGGSRDAREGMEAFLQKRAAQWTGR